MNSFWHMLAASLMMLRRNQALIISSLGLGIISIVVFGWLFGSSGNFTLQLGIVDADVSPISAQLLASLQHNPSLAIHVGEQTSELADLRAGHRDAVLVLP